ncbi:MAG: MFS transporter [Acidobacteria bacterium]|nr:MFS transporter [Acidobacteriota bacterium]
MTTIDATERPDGNWWIPFSVTIFAMLVLQMSNLGAAPLYPAIRENFGMTYSQYGLFTGMYGLGALLLSVPGGMLAKRFGEKNVLASGLLVVILGLALLSLAWNTITAFAGHAIWLLGYRPAFVCVMTAIALTAPKSVRSRSMATIGAVSALGFIIGGPVGGRIGEEYGWRSGILSFAAMAFIGAVVFYLFYRTKKESAPPSSKPDPETVKTGPTPGAAHPDAAKTKSVFRNPVLWAIALLEGMVGVGFYNATHYVPMEGKEVFHLDATDTAYILSIGFIAAIFGNMLLGWLMDRYNKWNVMALMMVILIPASLAMTADNLLIYRIATAVLVAVGLATAQQSYALAAWLSSEREMGNVMGAVAFGTGIFGYIGPQTLGFLRDWTGGFDAGWCFVAAVAVLSLIIIIILKYHLKRKTEMNT